MKSQVDLDINSLDYIMALTCTMICMFTDSVSLSLFNNHTIYSSSKYHHWLQIARHCHQAIAVTTFQKGTHPFICVIHLPSFCGVRFKRRKEDKIYG